MTFLNWDGRYVASARQSLIKNLIFRHSACRPLIDVKQRVFACLAGRPRPTQGNDTYDAAVCAATQLCETEGAQATGDGRRGDFVAVSAGVSFGGGQRRPGVLLNSRTNAAICAALVAHWSFQRITHFGNGIFRVFAPALHKFYKEQMSVLHAAAPHLRRLFPEALSVFAACTFNFGPSTVTFPHIDAANLAWGWCSITALGNFNPDLGGHLILWDLNLVIRFPPGSTIMIPSALLRHSNIAIQQGEKRYSFTQFTAGGLFRWVNNGHRSDKEFFGVRMFKVWDVAL
ncbi:hypothetical protein C8R43DRAFT_876463 [Mycena crocata]|nr:hypothetical protein C8R43DRAFT_876463 [Mycena crocata]